MQIKSNYKAALLCIWVIGSLLLFGCSAQKRLNRKIERVEKFARSKDLVITDTILVHDTVIVERSSHDTITEIRFNDSVTVVNNERVRLVYHYDTLTREIFHEVECKEQIINRTIRVPIERIEHVTVKNPKWLYILIGILVLAIGILLYRFQPP